MRCWNSTRSFFFSVSLHRSFPLSVCFFVSLLCLCLFVSVLVCSVYTGRSDSQSLCFFISLLISLCVSPAVSVSICICLSNCFCLMFCSPHRLAPCIIYYTFSSLTPAACNSLFYLLLHPNLPLQFLSQPTPPLTTTSPSLRLSAPISMPPTYASVCLLSV